MKLKRKRENLTNVIPFLCVCACVCVFPPWIAFLQLLLHATACTNGFFCTRSQSTANARLGRVYCSRMSTIRRTRIMFFLCVCENKSKDLRQCYWLWSMRPTRRPTRRPTAVDNRQVCVRKKVFPYKGARQMRYRITKIKIRAFISKKDMRGTTILSTPTMVR